MNSALPTWNASSIDSRYPSPAPNEARQRSRCSSPQKKRSAVQSESAAHPLDVGAAAVARYFKIEDECAQAVRLKLVAQQHDATQPSK